MLANRVEEFMDEARPIHEVHQKILHAAKRPVSLKEAESYGESHGQARQCGDLLPIYLLPWTQSGKGISFQRRLA